MTSGVYDRAIRLCEVPDCSEIHLAKGMCQLHYHRNRNGTSEPELLTGDFRVCTKCGEEKPNTSFRKQSKGQGGRARVCKKCDQVQNQTWKDKPENKDRYRLKASRRKAVSNYGIEGGFAWDRIQSGAVCDACGDRRPKMSIDHNHTTGKFRGILCLQCNTALGLLGETPDKFLGLMTYLFTHESEFPPSKYSDELDESDLTLIADLLEGTSD